VFPIIFGDARSLGFSMGTNGPPWNILLLNTRGGLSDGGLMYFTCCLELMLRSEVFDLL
jgi:hypothetical protein